MPHSQFTALFLSSAWQEPVLPIMQRALPGYHANSPCWLSCKKPLLAIMQRAPPGHNAKSPSWLSCKLPLLATCSKPLLAIMQKAPPGHNSKSPSWLSCKSPSWLSCKEPFLAIMQRAPLGYHAKSPSWLSRRALPGYHAKSPPTRATLIALSFCKEDCATLQSTGITCCDTVWKDRIPPLSASRRPEAWTHPDCTHAQGQTAS